MVPRRPKRNGAPKARSISLRFNANAAIKGDVRMIELLAEHCSSCVFECGLEQAANSTASREMVQLLLDLCVAKSSSPILLSSAVGRALLAAAENNRIDLVQIFAGRSEIRSKWNALVKAAAEEQIELIEALAGWFDEISIAEALARLPRDVNVAVS